MQKRKIQAYRIPGIRVTVYLPPYLVGLKISDWTLAKAVARLAGERKSRIKRECSRDRRYRVNCTYNALASSDRQ